MTAGRRYDDQMMLIDRSVVCGELRSIADDLGTSHAELLRMVVAAALPDLRRSAAARRREAKRTAARRAAIAAEQQGGEDEGADGERVLEQLAA